MEYIGCDDLKKGLSVVTCEESVDLVPDFKEVQTKYGFVSDIRLKRVQTG